MKYLLLLLLPILIWGCSTPQADVFDTIRFNGSTYSPNISSVSLDYRIEGEDSWHSSGMNSTDSSVNLSIIGDWDTSFVNDCNVTVRLNVTDQYSQSAYDYVFLTVNNLDIQSPIDQQVNVLNDSLQFNGTATGSTYGNYTIRYTNDTRPYSWSSAGVTLVDGGIADKVNATLATFNSSYVVPGRYYLFNISMESTLGFTNSETINVSFMGQDIYEPDDDYTNASWITTDNTHQEHTFVPEMDYDYVKFNATTGYKYIIETFADDPESYYSDTSMYLYDSDGLSFLDYDSYSGEGDMARLEFLPLRNDTYYVEVYNPYMYVGGRYNISVTQVDRYHKGVIPNSYSIPFYTYDQNPYTCTDMQEGDTCNQSWQVYVRADTGTAYDFFAMYDTDDADNQTDTLRVNISNYPAPTLSIIYPSQGSSIPQDSGEIDIIVDTDVPAFCRYSTSPLFSYYWDGASFFTTGDSRHTLHVQTEANEDYDFYYICRNLHSVYSGVVTHSFDTTGDQSSSSSSSSSSGGGGGGSSSGGGGPTSTTTGKSKTWFRVSDNDWLTWDPESDIISNIKIQIRGDHQDAKLTVDTWSGAPAGVPELAGIYRYINISPENLAIRQAYLMFRVNRSWSDGKDVKMMRYNGTWKELDTMKLEEDSIYSHHRAITPGFSIFAIGGEDLDMERDIVVPDEEMVEENTSQDNTDPQVISEDLNKKDVPEDTQKVLVTALIVAVVAGIVASIMLSKKYITIRKKRKEEEKLQELQKKGTGIQPPSVSKPKDIEKGTQEDKRTAQEKPAQALPKEQEQQKKQQNAQKATASPASVDKPAQALPKEQEQQKKQQNAQKATASPAPGQGSQDSKDAKSPEEELKKELDGKIEEMKKMVEELDEVPEPKKP